MYEVFEQLLQKHGVTPYKVAKETGVTQTSLSNWKAGRSVPSMKTFQKLADYFGVSIEYLMTGKNNVRKASSELTARDERDIQKKLEATLNELESNDGLMFNGEALDDATKELLALSLRNALESAKITAKQKFTPKKYRN